MSRTAVLLLFLLMLAGGSQASTINCAGSSATVAACIAADSIYWTDSLDYSALGSVGASHLTGSPWSATTPGGVTVSLQSNDTLQRVDNTISTPLHFANNNALISDTGHNALIIKLDTPMIGAAFRLSLLNAGALNATINAYSSATPSGLPVASLSLMPGGGTCGTYPCNDAPFVGFFNLSTQIRSLVVTTLDSGFFLSQLFLEQTPPTSPAPEPVTGFLIGGGLLAMAAAGKRYAARQR